MNARGPARKDVRPPNALAPYPPDPPPRSLMSGKPQHRFPPKAELEQWLDADGSVRAVANRIGCSDPGLRSHLKREGITLPRESWRKVLTAHKLPEDSDRHVTSDDPAEWGDIEALLVTRGLKPSDWVVVRVRVNEWGENKEGEPLRQLRVDLLPRSFNTLLPARVDGWRPPPRLAVVPKQDAELVVFFGDHHAPFHDPDLHVAACAWLRKNKPNRGVICGDLLDYDTVSRHRKNPRWKAEAQECVDDAYSILRSYVQASLGTRWQLLSGNHEQRMRDAVIDNLAGIYGLTQAIAPEEERGEAVLSVTHLLRLDELGIEWVGSDGEYSHEQIKVSPHLAARHGWIARKGSGASAVATLDALRYSVFIGHCHRQAIVKHTAHSIDGEPMNLTGVEIGTMAKIRGGLGYVPGGHANWQQGFATARLWPDGRFSCDLAEFVDGSLVWANQRFGPGTVLPDLSVAA